MSSRNFMDDVGLELIGFVDGEYVVRLDIAPRHLNSVGIVHGGVLCTMLDTAMARTVFENLPQDKKNACSTLEIKINFLKPTTSGKLTAHGMLMNLTNHTAFVEGVVKNQEGKLVAKASGTVIHSFVLEK